MIEGIFIFVFGDIHPDILTHRKNNGERELGEQGSHASKQQMELEEVIEEEK